MPYATSSTNLGLTIKHGGAKKYREYYGGEPSIKLGIGVSYGGIYMLETAIQEIVDMLPQMRMEDAIDFAKDCRNFARKFAPRRKTADNPDYREKAGNLISNINYSIVERPKGPYAGGAGITKVISLYSSARSHGYNFPYSFAQEFGTKDKVAKNMLPKRPANWTSVTEINMGLKAGMVKVSHKGDPTAPYMRFEAEPGKWVTVRRAKGNPPRMYMALGVAAAWVNLARRDKKRLDDYARIASRYLNDAVYSAQYTKPIESQLKSSKPGFYKMMVPNKLTKG